MSIPLVLMHAFALMGASPQLTVEARDSRGFYGDTIGLGGIAAGVDAQGRSRIVSDADQLTWVVSEWDALIQEYVAIHVAPIRGEELRDLLITDLNGDGELEILALYGDGVILVHRFDSFEALAEFDTQLDEPRMLLAANLVVGQAGTELLVLDDLRTQVYSATGSLLSEYSVGGDHCVVGQVDGDAGLELIVNSGQVLDMSTGLVEWTHAPGFGVEVAVVDTDGDGVDEIVAAEEPGTLRGFDAITRWEEWTLPTDQLNAVRVADFDDDGDLELLCGLRSKESVVALNPLTRATEWVIEPALDGVSDLAWADLDGDTRTELVWSGGSNSSGEDELYVAEGASQTVEWASFALEGPFLGPILADLEGDGQPELLVSSFTAQSGSDKGRLLVYDPVTLALLSVSPSDHRRGFHFDLAVADPDGDGRDQVFLATDRSHDALVQVWSWDRVTGWTLDWENSLLPQGESFRAIQVVDLDGDGTHELLLGAAKETTASTGSAVYVYAYPEGTERWRSTDLGDFFEPVRAVLAVDLDGDAAKEVVTILEGRELHVLDSDGNLLLTQAGNFTSLDVGPTFSMGRGSILTGDITGRVALWRADQTLLDRVFQFRPADASISGVAIATPGLVLVGAAGRLHALRLSDLAPLAQSAAYGGELGRWVAQAPGGGWLAAGQYGLHRFAP